MNKMKSDVIERWAADVLTVLVVSKEGGEHDLWVMLHHLFSAVKMFDQMDDCNKAVVEDLVKKTKSMFEARFSLKKRKMKTKKKEKNTPTPLRKVQEKEKEEEEERLTPSKKADDLEKRREAFRQECLSYVGKYDPQQVADFFHYWAEEVKDASKMLFEMQRSWNLGFRISRWVANNIASENAVASMRLRKTKAREAEAAAAAGQSAAAAALREQQNARREAELEEAKRMAGGLAETMNANPDGILARIARESAGKLKIKN